MCTPALNYDNAGNTGLEDSQTNAVRLEVRRDVSERDIARVRMGAAHMDPDLSSSSDAYQMTAGWEHRFSEEAGVSFDAGGSYRDRDGETDTGFVFTVRGFRRTEVGDMYVRGAALSDAHGLRRPVGNGPSDARVATQPLRHCPVVAERGQLSRLK